MKVEGVIAPVRGRLRKEERMMPLTLVSMPLSAETCSVALVGDVFGRLFLCKL